MVYLVAGLGFEPRIAKAYETSPVTGPFPHNYLSIVEHTTEIEYEGIEPSSTPHVLDARFSQANVLNNIK